MIPYQTSYLFYFVIREKGKMTKKIKCNLEKAKQIFYSCDTFILRFENNHAGGNVQLKINLVSPYDDITMSLANAFVVCDKYNVFL